MRSIWIMGYGKFGRLAAKRLSARYPESVITIVDNHSEKLKGIGYASVCADSAAWLNEQMENVKDTDIIIPAVPVHFAFEWAKKRLEKGVEVRAVDISDTLLNKMPNPIRVKTGKAFVSHATFICPDNCSEPADKCTYTGKKRPKDLFRLLGDIKTDRIKPVVIQSRQYSAGVGGYTLSTLKKSLDIIRSQTDAIIMMATACRCHGVVDMFQMEKR